MKKIITSLLLLFSSATFFAQDNWDSVAMGGLAPYQARFYDMLQYNGKIYAASDSGYQVPYLYSSASGGYGTWQAEDSLKQFLQGGAGTSEDLLSRLATDGTYLFIGSANYSAGFQTPQVYRYDGTNYKKHGFISYSGQPYNYSDISAMEFFSATGAPDSIFAFVTCNTGMQVWKTSTTTASPTWVNALTMSSVAEIVNDAVVFNGKLYAATCGDANGGFILRSANGMVWDTVGYGGFGNTANQSVKSFAVYNGELYAGTQNTSTGAELYKTSDGVTWTNVSLSSLGFNSNLSCISDIKVTGGRMFFVFRTDSAGFKNIHVAYTNNGITFLTSSSGAPIDYMQMSTSTFGDYRIENFNGAVFATGPTASNYGSIWRLRLPVADFTPSTFNVCQYSSINYTNTSSTYCSSYYWYDDIGNTSTSANYSQNYSALGVVNVYLKAYNGGIYDSIKKQITVASNPALVGTGATVNACANMTYQLGDYVQASGGTPPYNFDWWNGPTHFYTVNPSYSPTTSLTFTISLTDANGCSALNGPLFFPLGASTDLRGHVTMPPATNVDSGIVYAFKKHPSNVGLDTAAWAYLNAGTGNYLFPALDSGTYYIKVIPEATLFPTSISTYFGNAFRWDSSAVVVHQCAQTDTADIQVLVLPAQTGTASISGTILEDIGFGMRLPGNGGTPPLPFVPGGPIRGVDVKLGKNPGGGLQARTTSDTNGRYVFINIPVGSYRIYVDIPNLPMDSTHDVTVTPTTDSIPNNDYKADSASIFIPSTAVGIKDLTNSSNAELRMYPNPAKDKVTVLAEVDKESTLTYELRDLTGKIIQSANGKRLSKGKNSVEINLLNDIKPGMYLMNYYINATHYVSKLVITE